MKFTVVTLWNYTGCGYRISQTLPNESIDVSISKDTSKVMQMYEMVQVSRLFTFCLNVGLIIAMYPNCHSERERENKMLTATLMVTLGALVTAAFMRSMGDFADYARS